MSNLYGWEDSITDFNVRHDMIRAQNGYVEHHRKEENYCDYCGVGNAGVVSVKKKHTGKGVDITVTLDHPVPTFSVLNSKDEQVERSCMVCHRSLPLTKVKRTFSSSKPDAHNMARPVARKFVQMQMDMDDVRKELGL